LQRIALRDGQAYAGNWRTRKTRAHSPPWRFFHSGHVADKPSAPRAPHERIASAAAHRFAAPALEGVGPSPAAAIRKSPQDPAARGRGASGEGESAKDACRAACFPAVTHTHIYIYIYTSPPSAVGRAQGPQPCGRGFEPHGGCYADFWARLFQLPVHCAHFSIRALLDGHRREGHMTTMMSHRTRPHAPGARRSRQFVNVRAALVRALRFAGDWQAGGSGGMRRGPGSIRE
jgi:hypothetical protein